MIVQCSQCSTKFRINDASVGPRGAKVRCSRCQNVFTVAPLGAAQSDSDFVSDRTHAFDTSQFMRAAASKTAKNPPAPRAAPHGEATQVVDSRALLDQLKGSEAKGAKPATDPAHESATQIMDARAYMDKLADEEVPALPPRPASEDDAPPEGSTQVMDARAFMDKLKNDGVSAGFTGGGGDHSTQITTVADMDRLKAPPPLPGNSPPPLPGNSPHDQETRVGPVVTKSGSSSFPSPHDQATQVAAIFTQGGSTPWAPAGEGAGKSAAEVTAPPTPGLLPGAPQGEETHQADVLETSVEALALPPPPAMSWVITAFAVLVLLSGAFVSWRAEALVAMMAVRLGLSPVVTVDDTPVNGLHLQPVRAQLYPLTATNLAWVVTGTVENTTQSVVRDVDAVAELRDRLGRVVGQAMAPVGLELDPSEFPDNPTDLQATVEKALRQVPPPGVDPGGEAPFVAVLLDPPLPLHGEPQKVHLAVRPPLPPVAEVPAPAPAPPPAPAVAEEPAPPAPVGKKVKGAKAKAHHKKAASQDQGP